MDVLEAKQDLVAPRALGLSDGSFLHAMLKEESSRACLERGIAHSWWLPCSRTQAP